MPTLRAWLHRLLGAFGAGRPDRDLEEELRLHAELAAEDAARGDDAAIRESRVRLGGRTQVVEALRDQRGLPWLRDLVHDVRHAARLLTRAPGFAAVAILSLALGIGANVVIFSVVDAALFRPLPYKDADRLVDLIQTAQTRGGDRMQIEAMAGHFIDLRGLTSVFSGSDVFCDPRDKTLANAPDTSVAVGALLPTFTDFLGVVPELGRTFGADEALARDRVVISDAYWRRAFGADRGVIGRTIPFNDGTRTIIGVMPPTFRYFVGVDTDAWVPVTPAEIGPSDGCHVIARLRAGLPIAAAQQELNDAIVSGALGWRPLALDLYPADWNRAGGYFGKGLPSTRTMLLCLLAAVGLVLAIACANVANLLLARTVSRQREIAVRGAMGATRLRLVRQFVTEGFLLAGLGAVAGIIVGSWGARAFPAIVPARLTFAIFGSTWPQLDARVLGIACAAAILTGAICGVIPAIRASRPQIQEGAWSGGRGVAGGGRRQRHVGDALLALQVALSLILLTGAGLLTVSLTKMIAVPAGFDPRNLSYLDFSFPQTYSSRSGETDPRVTFAAELVRATVGAPGLERAAIGTPPVSGGNTTALLLPDSPGDENAVIDSFTAGPGYFETIRLPLLQGRLFGPEDDEASPPVAIVSENVARRFWPGRSAIGQRFRRWTTEPWLTIVGIVPHIRTTNLLRDGGEIYVPLARRGAYPSIVFRVTSDPAFTAQAIRAAAARLDERISVSAVATVTDVFMRWDPMGAPRFYSTLLGLLAALGLATAAVGLFGVASYAVNRRTQEFGVRLALGATRARLCALMLRDVLTPVAIGTSLGLITSLWLSRWLASQLFETSPHDPFTIAGVVGLFAAVSATAMVTPLRRAMRVDSVEALRAE